jgi:hypothetical protein
MDNITKGILAVIAVALCTIAFKLYSPGGSFVGAPTFGDFYALREIKDPEQRKEKRMRLMKSIPLVRVQGGQIDADVSGNVSIDN